MLIDITGILKDLPGTPSFKNFSLQDVNPLGGTRKNRKLCKPNRPMRILHRRIIESVRSLPIDLSSSTACRPGDSPVKNINRHRHRRYFYITDLHNAYPNVNSRRLAEVLMSLDLSLNGRMEILLAFLSRFCFTSEGGLAIGLPASPDLFNLYAAVLIDTPMRELCERYRLTYTRYLDDLTFSAEEPIGVRKRKELRKVICAAGFAVQHRKSQVCYLKKGPIFINGIGLDETGRVFIPRRYLRFIDGRLHFALKPNSSVGLPVIAGLMGVFHSLEISFFNQIEVKTLERCRRFKQLLRLEKR